MTKTLNFNSLYDSNNDIVIQWVIFKFEINEILSSI